MSTAIKVQVQLGWFSVDELKSLRRNDIISHDEMVWELVARGCDEYIAGHIAEGSHE